MKKMMGVYKNPKKPTRFCEIDVVKRYLYISCFDDLFKNGEDGMVQIEYIDYGLDWAKLKPGEEGNTAVFEITDFTILCPEEQVRWNRILEKQKKKEDELLAWKRAKAKMRTRIRRIILGCCMRKLYWLPSMTHGRNLLALMCAFGNRAIETMGERVGVFLFSFATAYCLRCSESF